MSFIKLISCFLVAITIFSCKTRPDADTQYVNKDKVYKLFLKPDVDSKYYYDISNKSEIKVEVDGKKVDNISKTSVGANYEFKKDSAGNFLVSVMYDKIHIYSKNKDTETDMDAANAAFSMDPVEKMLGDLKAAHIRATVSPAGEVITVDGYKELADKIMQGFNSTDAYTKNILQTKLDQLISDGIIKQNMDQLFKIYPDSALHIGDRWKSLSKQNGEISLNVKSIYTLKDIDNDVAIIKIEGELISDKSAPANFTSMTNASTDLKGQQQGEYKMDTKTGLLISGKMTAKIEGTIQAMGREIPVVIKTTLELNNRREN
jgi:hypothetical protein